MAMSDRQAPAICTGSRYEALQVMRAREAVLSGAMPPQGLVSEVLVESWRRSRENSSTRVCRKRR